MKMNKFIKFIILTTGIVSLSSCGKNKDNTEPTPDKGESLTPVAINSLYDGMVALYQTKNYTFDITKREGTTPSEQYTLKFRQDYIGYDGSRMTDFKGTINDGSGLFNVHYEDSFVTSEYLKKDSGALATSLWDNSVVHTMYGVGGQFIKKNITPQMTYITVTDKDYIIGFIQTLGYSSTIFSKINYLKAEIEGGVVQLRLQLALTQTTTYKVKLVDVGTTASEHLKTFREEGNKVFTPVQDLQEMRRLIKLDNYIHQIYSISEGQGSYTGYEFMTPNYFMVTGNADKNSGYVYMEVDHKADDNINADLYGVYLFTVSKVDNTHFEWGYSPNPINTTPEIEKVFHYPSFLKLLTNLEYVKEGELRGSEYVLEDVDNVKKYYFTEQFLVNDFADNFSLSSQFENCTGLGVAVELDLTHDADKDKNIVFHYLMKYEGDGQTYDVILPLMWFGAANKAHVDLQYQLLNNKN